MWKDSRGLNIFPKALYLMEAQVVLDGWRGVEDGAISGDHQDKTIQGLRREREDK